MTIRVGACIVAAQLAAEAASELLAHVRDGAEGRFQSECLEKLCEALKLAIAAENVVIEASIDLAISETVRPVLKYELDEARQLQAALSKWEGRF